jgi:hypothetical protein
VAAMITMVTYDGVCCLGFNIDPDSITDVPVFERCLHEGFRRGASTGPLTPTCAVAIQIELGQCTGAVSLCGA